MMADLMQYLNAGPGNPYAHGVLDHYDFGSTHPSHPMMGK